jgi:hypothetical protein
VILTTSLADVLTWTPVVIGAGRGFDWTASAIGAAGGFGLALALFGSIALLRGRPTNHDPREGENQ